MKKTLFLLLFVAGLAFAAAQAQPAQAVGDCYAAQTGGIDNLSSTDFSFDCPAPTTVYFGVCDSGSVPNDDLFEIEYAGSIVSHNVFQNDLEYLVIGSGQANAGSNSATLRSLSNSPALPATYSYVVSSDRADVEAGLASVCGTDFAGGPPPAGACTRSVPLFTMDTAPSDGVLQYYIAFGEENRPEGYLLRTWSVSAGEQINNSFVETQAPHYVRVWWQPEGDSTWYLLPSQYWHGGGTAASEYGLSCGDGAPPSYHTSFDQAIPQNEVPLTNLD